MKMPVLPHLHAPWFLIHFSTLHSIPRSNMMSCCFIGHFIIFQEVNLFPICLLILLDLLLYEYPFFRFIGFEGKTTSSASRRMCGVAEAGQPDPTCPKQLWMVLDKSALYLVANSRWARQSRPLSMRCLFLLAALGMKRSCTDRATFSSAPWHDALDLKVTKHAYSGYLVWTSLT